MSETRNCVKFISSNILATFKNSPEYIEVSVVNNDYLAPVYLQCFILLLSLASDISC